ncbi:MAG: hypothetical protein ACMUIP_11830, partial [bacterium]
MGNTKKSEFILTLWIIIAAVLFINSISFAQWQLAPNGEDIYNINSGNVGIGTISPEDHDNFSKALDISGTVGAAIYLRTSDANTRLTVGSTATQYYIYGKAANPMVFYTNGTEGMRIVNGNLGIGATNPTEKLQVASSSAGEVVSFRNSNGNYGLRFMVNDFSDSLGYGLAGLSAIRVASNEHFAVVTGGTPTPKLVVRDNGNVGIGTTAPDSKLHVDNNDGSARINISHTNTISNFTQGVDLGMLAFGGKENTDTNYTAATIRAEADATWGDNQPSRLVFSTYDNGLGDHMVINQIGNVGIGTTNPTEKLQVSSSSAGEVVSFRSSDGNYGLRFMVNDSSDSLGYGLAGLIAIRVASNEHFAVVTGGIPTPKLIVKDNGNVGIGETNPQSKLAVNGTITAKEVVVTQEGWADFVFEENYPLASLEEVESYIKGNKHLPDMPSSKEIKQEGLAMADMMARQMQKIEELTLYLIEIKKENYKMKDRIDA